MNETRLILPTTAQLEAHVLELQEELKTARQMLTVTKRLAKQRQDRPLQALWESDEEPDPQTGLSEEPAFTTAPPGPPVNRTAPAPLQTAAIPAPLKTGLRRAPRAPDSDVAF